MSIIELPVISFRDQSGGMMSMPDDFLIPDNASKLSVNFRHDRIGSAVQRYGYEKIGGSPVAASCDGMGWFENAAGTRNRLIAAFGGANYAWDGAGWTGIGGGMTLGHRVRYEYLLDLVFRVGGNSATASWDGNTSTVFGNSQLVGAPSGTVILAYKSRIYIAGNSSFPDRVYFSSVPDVSGNITWDSNDYFDVNPSDGDNITGLAKVGTLMMIFKRNHTYRFNGTATDPDPIINIGTISQETVNNVNGTIYYFHPRGIFSTEGGIPSEVSRPIKDWIDSIPSANYSLMSSYQDGDRYGLFVGDLTVDGRDFTNVILEYDTNVKCWQVHSMGHAFRSFTNAIDSTGKDYIAGGGTGYAYTMFTGNIDDTLPIPYEKITRSIDFEGLYSTKEVNEGAFYVKNGHGSLFQAIPDDLNPVTLGVGGKYVNQFTGKSVKGNTIEFRISGVNSKEPAIWRGFDIIKSRTSG